MSSLVLLFLPDGLHDRTRIHRQPVHAHADGPVHRVGHGGRRRHDIRFADSAHAEGMSRIGNLDDHEILSVFDALELAVDRAEGFLTGELAEEN